jgi:hypothetical protein
MDQNAQPYLPPGNWQLRVQSTTLVLVECTQHACHGNQANHRGVCCKIFDLHLL